MSKYKFEGYTISCCGYHQPDHCVWWEACDDDGLACFHGKTLREVEFLILESKFEDKLREKEREIAELRECLKEAVTEVCNRLEKCGFKEPCVFKTCYVQKWRKALQDEGGAK